MDSDQRKSFRILAPDGQLQGVLCVGRRSTTVRIVDSSAGGFALASNETLPVKKGDLLRLRTSAGWHEVRIARQEYYTDGVLLGVERLADIDDPRELERVKSGWMDYIFPPYAQGGVSGTKFAGIFTGGALAGIVLAGLVALLANYRPPKRNAAVLPQAADEVVTNFAIQARRAAERMQAESTSGSTTARAAGSAKSSKGLDNLFRQLAGGQRAADDLATRLGLSSDQRNKLDSIVNQSAGSSDKGAQILQVLTAEQSRQLESLAH
jgi:hypothetical protein